MLNPERLELARKRRRLPVTILAARAGISNVSLSRIIHGVHAAEDDTVDALARALDYPIEFLIGADVDPIDPSAVSFRSLKAMTARERDAAVAAGSLAYLVTDWINAEYNLPEVELLDLSQERDPVMAARTLRNHWAMGEKPVGHMIKLLESKGVRVFSLAENTKNVDAFSCWRGSEPFVFLNTYKTTERSRFDAAHELGHLVLHKHGGAQQGKSAEVEANAFASAFLMPEADVVASLPYVSRVADLVKVKKRWGVSTMALAYRLHRLEIITDWQYRMFCININRTYGHDEPESLNPERSSIWNMILTDLWKRGMTRHHIAAALHIPEDEMENLLFGLAGGSQPSERPQGRPKLRAV